jgi:hypothetical protein
MKIRTLLFTFIVALALTAHAGIEQDFRCLSSSGKKSVSLEFRQVGDSKVKWSAGYILYKGSKQAIPIVLAKSEVTDQPPDRPWEFEDTWAEIVSGKVAGTYIVSHQGANITSFTYKSEKDGKEFSFAQDIEHTGERSCKW